MRSIVLCRLPVAGLGNQLLVWAKALVFAETHGLEMIHSGWSRPSRTRVTRILSGNETWLSKIHPSPIARRIYYHLAQSWRCREIVEPLPSWQPKAEGQAIVFDKVPHWEDYFAGLREHRDLLISALPHILRPGIQAAAAALPPPLIAVHVRMGDFHRLAANVDFSKAGQTRTPQSYFQAAIEGLRHYCGWEAPIHLLSDGSPQELAPLLTLPAVTLAPQRPAIIDLLWMSRARAIVCSAGSTFGFWAGFLGHAALLHHPAHAPKPLRDDALNARIFDGAAAEDWREWPPLLRQNLQAIVPPAAR